MITEKSSIPRPGEADQPKPPAVQPANAPTRRRASAAAALSPLVRNLLGGQIPVRFEFWDGSAIGPDEGVGTIHVRSADALRRILWAPGELGVGRAYVAGDIEIEGDIIAMMASLHAVAPRTCEWACALCLRPWALPIGPAPSAFLYLRRPKRPASEGCDTPSGETSEQSRTTTTSATIFTSSCSGRP